MRQIYETDVYAASDFVAVAGVNEGDAVGPATDLVPDDCYALARDAEMHSVRLNGSAPERLRITGGMRPRALRAEATLTLMTSQTALCEIIVLAETATGDAPAQRWIAPSSPITPAVSWRLVEVRPTVSLVQFERTRAPLFSTGTRVTLASGRLCAVEDLRAGDSVLTRDNGPQIIRHVAHRVSAATGPDTAIRIGAGVLNNPRALTIGAANRLVLNGNSAPIAAGALVDGAQVTAHHGGYLDYVTLHFDAAETVYVEGVLAKTTPLRGAT